MSGARVTKSLAALLPASLMAAEGGGKAPELSPVWEWLNFLILAGVLGWLISKHLGPLLVARTRQIHEGLAAGEKAKAEAEAQAAAVQAKLANRRASWPDSKSVILPANWRSISRNRRCARACRRISRLNCLTTSSARSPAVPPT